MEVVVTTGAINCAKLQSNRYPSHRHPVFYRPDVLPIAQPTVSRALRGRGKNIVDYSTETVQTRHLSPEDPQRAGDDDRGRDDDIDDQPSGDDRILGLAWRLLEHVMIHRLHSQTVQTHIHRVSENSRLYLFFAITSATVNQFLYFFHRLIYKGSAEEA